MILYFLVAILIFLIGTACFTKIFHFSIQQDQWLDQLLGWQNMLERFGHKTGFGNEFIYKAGGGCSYCLSHLTAFISFWMFILILYFGFGLWLHVGNLAIQIILNLVIYLFYVSTSTLLNNLAINKL